MVRQDDDRGGGSQRATVDPTDRATGRLSRSSDLWTNRTKPPMSAVPPPTVFPGRRTVHRCANCACSTRFRTATAGLGRSHREVAFCTPPDCGVLCRPVCSEGRGWGNCKYSTFWGGSFCCICCCSSSLCGSPWAPPSPPLPLSVCPFPPLTLPSARGPRPGTDELGGHLDGHARVALAAGAGGVGLGRIIRPTSVSASTHWIVCFGVAACRYLRFSTSQSLKLVSAHKKRTEFKPTDEPDGDLQDAVPGARA